HGGLFQFVGILCVLIECAVNNVGPLYDLRHRCGIEPEALLGYRGQELGTGAEAGIVELAVALVLFKMFGVSGRQKRALVMIEPPGDFRRAGVLEIDDGIFPAVEFGFIEERTGTVQQSAENEVGILPNALLIETRKQGGRAGTVETLIVIEDFDFQTVSISGCAAWLTEYR